MRIKLGSELADVINEYGPKVFEDFNEVCLAQVTICVLIQAVLDSHPCSFSDCSSV